MSRSRKPETEAAQARGVVDDSMHGLVPPLWLASSYRRAADGSYPGGHSYTRDQNPTYDAAEALLARLEGGAEARLFASGMAAATSVFEALEPGAHVVAPEGMYFTLKLWLRDQAQRGRLQLDFIPTGDLDALRAAVRPERTRLVWVETPSNPFCEITDIAAAAEIAHAPGARLVADSTLATPVLTRPLELGADLVMHSATKQLNGHADVVAGALCCARDDELWQRVRHERAYRGAILGPIEAWLLLRGMRTLFPRVEKSAHNAQRVAEFLYAHDAVDQVYYPGLNSHPRHELATRQMDGGYGPIVSFRTGGNEAGARRVAAALELFADATSLGGVESLVEHRASVEGVNTSVPPDLLRLSIGIESADDLIADLDVALSGSRPD